jgi:hypothetical protein
VVALAKLLFRCDRKQVCVCAGGATKASHLRAAPFEFALNRKYLYTQQCCGLSKPTAAESYWRKRPPARRTRRRKLGEFKSPVREHALVLLQQSRSNCQVTISPRRH